MDSDDMGRGSPSRGGGGGGGGLPPHLQRALLGGGLDEQQLMQLHPQDRLLLQQQLERAEEEELLRRQSLQSYLGSPGGRNLLDAQNMQSTIDIYRQQQMDLERDLELRRQLLLEQRQQELLSQLDSPGAASQMLMSPLRQRLQLEAAAQQQLYGQVSPSQHQRASAQQQQQEERIRAEQQEERIRAEHRLSEAKARAEAEEAEQVMKAKAEAEKLAQVKAEAKARAQAVREAKQAQQALRSSRLTEQQQQDMMSDAILGRRKKKEKRRNASSPQRVETQQPSPPPEARPAPRERVETQQPSPPPEARPAPREDKHLPLEADAEKKSQDIMEDVARMAEQRRMERWNRLKSEVAASSNLGETDVRDAKVATPPNDATKARPTEKQATPEKTPLSRRTSTEGAAAESIMSMLKAAKEAATNMGARAEEQTMTPSEAPSEEKPTVEEEPDDTKLPAKSVPKSRLEALGEAILQAGPVEVLSPKAKEQEGMAEETPDPKVSAKANQSIATLIATLQKSRPPLPEETSSPGNEEDKCSDLLAIPTLGDGKEDTHSVTANEDTVEAARVDEEEQGSRPTELIMPSLTHDDKCENGISPEETNHVMETEQVDEHDAIFDSPEASARSPPPRSMEEGDGAVLDVIVEDDWWPSNNEIKREKRQREKDVSASGDVEVKSENHETADKKKRSQHSKIDLIEPGVLEKLPHCRIHIRHEQQIGSTPVKALFCFQVTELYPSDVMVCCSVCTTWRHAACGGHYRHHSINPRSAFTPVCDRCWAERRALEEDPDLKEAIEIQRMDHLRNTLAITQVIRQASFSMHTDSGEWPLGSVPPSRMEEHVKNVRSRHGMVEKEWNDMLVRLHPSKDAEADEVRNIRKKELKRLQQTIEEAEFCTDRHNMILFLQHDTSKEHPVGFETERRNFFDPADDPISEFDDPKENGHATKQPGDKRQSMSESTSDEGSTADGSSMAEASKVPQGNDTSQPTSKIEAQRDGTLSGDSSSAGGHSCADSAPETDPTEVRGGPTKAPILRTQCIRPGCSKKPRFDSKFCSDACGVATMELDLLSTLEYSTEIHPSLLLR